MLCDKNVHRFRKQLLSLSQFYIKLEDFMIGVIYMATGLYNMFWKRFYFSCEMYLCPEIKKSYFVFSDDETILSLNLPNVMFIKYEDRGWLMNVTSKSECILSIEQNLKKMDYIFYFNANIEIQKPVYSQEILPSESENYLSALSFHIYRSAAKNTYPYDRNPQSLAYISFEEGKYYFQSSYYGGRTEEFLNLSKWCDHAAKEDLKKGIIARYHDESYLNRYLLDYHPKVLDTVYAKPEEWKYPENCKAVFFNKNRLFGQSTVSQIRMPFYDSRLSYLYNDKYEIIPFSIFNISGEIGIQMFQYAFFLSQKSKAEEHERCYINVDASYMLDNVFGISKDILPDEIRKQIQITPVSCIKYITEAEIKYEQITEKWKLLSIYEGKWQNAEYFKNMFFEIRQQFVFDENKLNAKSRSLLPMIKSENSVSIHIFPNTAHAFDYYKKAVNILESTINQPLHFYIFGDTDHVDDIGIPEKTIVNWNHENRWQDMCLMSACKHHIISTDATGWWAAFLSNDKNRKIIAPNTCGDFLKIKEFTDNWTILPVDKYKESTSDKLNSIIKLLSVCAFDLKDPGLLYGKMGIVILLFHYARYTNDETYEEIAINLYDTIQKDIDINTPVNYSSGLAGIGTGVEYLFQQGFVTGDSKDVLEDFDAQITSVLMQTDYFDAGLEYGLCGTGKYCLYRMKQNISDMNHQQNITRILDLLDNQKQFYKKNANEILLFLMELYHTACFKDKVQDLIRYYTQNYEIELEFIVHKLNLDYERQFNNKIKYLQNIDISPSLIGSKTDYAKLGLSLIPGLRSWIKLIF
jgi:hypothetical protein